MEYFAGRVKGMADGVHVTGVNFEAVPWFRPMTQGCPCPHPLRVYLSRDEWEALLMEAVATQVVEVERRPGWARRARRHSLSTIHPCSVIGLTASPT